MIYKNAEIISDPVCPFVDTPENRKVIEAKIRKECIEAINKRYKENPPTPKEFTNYACQEMNITDDEKDRLILFMAISNDPDCHLSPGVYKFKQPVDLTGDKKCDGYTVIDKDRAICIQPHCYIENINLTITLNKQGA